MQQVLYPYIIFQSLLLAILLFTIGEKRNRYLSGYFFIYFFLYLFIYWYQIIDKSAVNKVISWWLPFFYTVGIISILFLFYYVQSLLRVSLPRKHYYLWGIPIVFIVAHIIKQSVSPYTSFEEYLSSNFRLVVFISTLCLIVTYYIWQIRQIKRVLKQGSEVLSQYTKIMCSWIRGFLWYKLILQTLPGIYITLNLVYNYNAPDFKRIYDAIELTLLLSTSIYLFLIAYIAMRSPDVFNHNDADVPTIEQKITEILLPASEKTVANKERYLPETIAQAIAIIHKALNTDNLYIDNEFSLSKLAKHTNLSQRLISYSIKKEFGQSLTEYINNLRVEYAKEMLANPANANKTIYAVALESGFNSEQSFYRIFKETAGITANQFRLQKQQLNS